MKEQLNVDGNRKRWPKTNEQIAAQVQKVGSNLLRRARAAGVARNNERIKGEVPHLRFDNNDLVYGDPAAKDPVYTLGYRSSSSSATRLRKTLGSKDAYLYADSEAPSGGTPLEGKLYTTTPPKDAYSEPGPTERQGIDSVQNIALAANVLGGLRDEVAAHTIELSATPEQSVDAFIRKKH